MPAYGGKVLVRKGAERFPIRGLYGPGIANELVRGEVFEAFERATPALRRRLEHGDGAILGVTIHPGSA